LLGSRINKNTGILGDVNMKKNVLKVVSIVMFLIAIIAIICAIVATGEGFLDLSNLARLFFLLTAVVAVIVGLITLKYGWKSAR